MPLLRRFGLVPLLLFPVVFSGLNQIFILDRGPLNLDLGTGKKMTVIALVHALALFYFSYTSLKFFFEFLYSEFYLKIR